MGWGRRSGSGTVKRNVYRAKFRNRDTMQMRAQAIYHVFFVMLFLFAVFPGCVTETPDPTNLTEDELAGLYLSHAVKISDLRSEYVVYSGMAAGNQRVERISFDYKAPFFARVEMEPEISGEQGSFATTSGTYTTWLYDSRTHTYDLSSGINLSREYDYQRIVRQIVADREFTILERDTEDGAARYIIEVVTDPWSDRYTPYISSRVRALIEPSTGLAWKIATYYDSSVAGQPTLAPGMVLPTPTPPPVDMAPPGTVHRSELPNLEVRYETIEVNTGIPDSYFEFSPPVGSGPRCIPKYVNYVEPPRMDPSVPISEPLPGRVRYSLNETDSGRVVTLERGEILEVTLRIIPSLAFRWLMPAEGSGLELLNAGAVSIIPHNFDLNRSDAVVYFKSNGYYRWRFLAKDLGTTVFDGIFSRDGCDIGGAKRFNLTVQVIDNSS